MDRQLANNLHLQVKAPAANDGLPSTSRQTTKNLSRPYKQSNKNGLNRFQNKQPRSREPKSLTQHLRDSVESSRNYLDESKYPATATYRRKTANYGKVSLKERFVQANCQFVMSSMGDISGHLKDPDLTISWDLVEEVLFTCTNNELCCPICLCQPTAGKISRCGHIYCWSCILHYLALSDKESRSCPICFETIKKDELKSVCIINKIDYAANDFLTFTLMKIPKNCTLALPANYESKESMHRIKRNTSQTLDLFGKIFSSSPSYMSDIFGREESELKQQLVEYQMENMPEVCFVHSAFDELQKRQLKLEQVSTLCEQFSDLVMLNGPQVEAVEDYIYFYQSDDGQSIYLHPLNVRMLKREYGDLKNCPLNITARIIEIHGESVNEEVRRRNAHLRHLPLSCEFKIAEVEFDTSIVSKATLDDFSLEINNRKKNRKRKEKVQNMRDRKIEIENNKKIYGISPAPTFKLDNAVDFPEYQMQSDESSAIDADPSLLNFDGLSSSPSGSSDLQSSFAKMLSSGGSGFDNTLRKPKPPSPEQLHVMPLEDGDDDSVTVQPRNITLSDFFDNCVKTSKRGKRGKRK